MSGRFFLLATAIAGCATDASANAGPSLLDAIDRAPREIEIAICVALCVLLAVAHIVEARWTKW